MQINELIHQAKDRVIRLREIIISPAPQPLRQQRMESVDRWDIRHLRRTRKRLLLGVVLLGAVMIYIGVVGAFVSPAVKRRAAAIE